LYSFQENGEMNGSRNGLAGTGCRQQRRQWLRVDDEVHHPSARRAARAIFFVSALAMADVSQAADPVPYSPAAARRGELVALVRQDCGSCHGLTLKGGLGPALLPATLASKDPAGLKATILHGRPGTAMPPWRRFFSDQEAEWIVANLQKGFPHE
jgi:cytochrome c55X